MNTRVVVIAVIIALCLIAHTESKPCDIRRWNGCRDSKQNEEIKNTGK